MKEIKQILLACLVLAVLATVIVTLLSLTVLRTVPYQVEVPREYNAQYFTYRISGHAIIYIGTSNYHSFPYTIHADDYLGATVLITIYYYTTRYSLPPEGSHIVPSLIYDQVGIDFLNFKVEG